MLAALLIVCAHHIYMYEYTAILCDVLLILICTAAELLLLILLSLL